MVKIISSVLVGFSKRSLLLQSMAKYANSTNFFLVSHKITVRLNISYNNRVIGIFSAVTFEVAEVIQLVYMEKSDGDKTVP